MLGNTHTTRRFRTVGVLLIAALAVEGWSLVARGPIAFLVFVAAAGILVCVTILGYLMALARQNNEERSPC